MQSCLWDRAAQGSIIGSNLWNVTSDEIFRIEMPDGAHLAGYADDVVAWNVEEVKQLIIGIKSWLEGEESNPERRKQS